MPRSRRCPAVAVPSLLIVACGALSLLASAPTAAQQKYLLKEVAAAGDVSDNTTVMTMAMQITATVGGQSVPLDMQMRSDEKYHEEVLAVDPKGAATTVRRAYSVKKESGKEPGGEAKSKVSSLQGKTVMIRRAGGKVDVTVAKGTIAAEDRKELADSLHDNVGVFPDHEVGPGDDWDVDPKAAKFLGDAHVTKASCHFQDVVDRGGHRCAHIRLTLEFSAKTGEQSPPIAVNVAGDLYQALDLQRALEMSLSGTGSMKGDVTENGMTVSINGEGPVELKMSAKWAKVAGKPIAAEKPVPAGH